MNINVSRNDFLFFQNEVFKDIKDLEIRINEKITSILSNVYSNKESLENNNQKFTDKISQLITLIETTEERLKIDEQLSSFKKKVDDILLTNKAKVSSLEKDINQITFKYDKIFLDNMTVAGIIGTACPFPNLSSFIEYAHKKIKELLIEKTKQNTDISNYKEKLETIIGTFNKQINNIEPHFIEHCNNGFKNYEKICNDKYKLLEDSIHNMRIENGKYSFDLIQKTNELKIDWEKIQKIQDNIYKRLNEELIKHIHTNNNLCKIFNSQRDEFKILKSRFTELSEFIKDVRFRNNINNIQNETEFEKKVKFKNMSKRINFNLKQKIEDTEKQENSLDKIKNIGYLSSNNENNLKLNQSFSNFIENNNANYNKYRQKSGILLNKPMNLGKVTSTLKNYFNQNKQYKSLKNKEKKIFSIFDDKIVYKRVKDRIKDKENEIDNDKYKTTEDFELSKKNIKKKPMIKRCKTLINSKNILKKNKHMFLEINEERMNIIDNNINDININLNINQNTKTKSSKTLPVISLKKEKLNSFSINKSRNKKINIKLNSFDLISKRKSFNTQFNKIEQFENNNIKNQKDKPAKNLKESFSDNINANDLLNFNSPNEFNSNNPSLSINKIENFINSIINPNDNNNDININNKKCNYILNNNQNDEPNLKKLSPNEKLKTKIIDFSDDNSFKNNNVNNLENDKLIFKNKYSFIINPNIKKDSHNNINPINSKDENENYYLLNKKIIKNNKKLKEVYQDLDNKINKLYRYVNKLFGDLTGRMFFKEMNNQNLFNLNLSPKTILTTSNFIIPLPDKKKKPLFYNEIEKIIKEKNFISPQKIEKIESYKSIINKIEPYLIKKFKT